MEKTSDLWIRPCIHVLATQMRSFLELSPFTVSEEFIHIDDFNYREKIIIDDIQSGVSEIVSKLANDMEFRRLIKESLPKRITIRANEVSLHSSSIMKTLISSDDGICVIRKIEIYEIYRELSVLLKAELNQQLGLGNSLPEDEKLLFLLLINYFRIWELPAKNLYKWFKDKPNANAIIRELLGIPGTEESYRIEIPLVKASPVIINASLKAHSLLLDAIEMESTSIMKDNGFLHRLLDIKAPIADEHSTMSAALGLDANKFANGRSLRYRQYEYYSLLFTSLASLEFLIRSCSSDNSSSRNLMDLINELNININNRDLLDRIKEIYDTRKLNLRNRALHGIFFDIEARSIESVLSSGVLNYLDISTLNIQNKAGLPENIACYVLELLEQLSNELQALPVNTDWTNDFHLTVEELSFAQNLKCDIFDSLEMMEKWLDQINDFSKSTCPCIHTPIELGFIAWAEKQSDNNIPIYLSYLFLFLEPAIRLTLYRLGQPILQQEIHENSYFFKYKMLDENGLLSEYNLNLLTQNLVTDEEKSIAKRTIKLASKCRDCFAHGAMHSIDENQRFIYGHLITKTIQQLSTIDFPDN